MWPGLGEFGAPGIAAEELDAQALFQGLDLMAHGRAGDAQFAGRQPEAAEPGGGFKGGQAHATEAGRVWPKYFTNGMSLGLHSTLEFHKVKCTFQVFNGD